MPLLPSLAVVVALADELVLGRGMAAGGAERVTDPVSLGFVRDMSTRLRVKPSGFASANPEDLQDQRDRGAARSDLSLVRSWQDPMLSV